MSSKRPNIGEEGLGELARAQVEAARNDPRLDRRRGAMVADFWDAVEEAERFRMLSILGIHELRHALEREEAQTGYSRSDSELPLNVASNLQAHWERAELARIEIEAGFPHLNAQTLVALFGALDAVVEEFAPAMRDLRIKVVTEHLMQRAEEAEPEAAEALSAEDRDRIVQAIRGHIAGELFPKASKPRGSGIHRYEAQLTKAGLGAPADRPIPDDLDRAMTELGAIRDVLVHRAGRIDETALGQAPTLPYVDGQFVRLSREQYRTYSAAVRCYASEIWFRTIRAWPDVSDESHGPDLTNWRHYCLVGA